MALLTSGKQNVVVSSPFLPGGAGWGQLLWRGHKTTVSSLPFIRWFFDCSFMVFFVINELYDNVYTSVFTGQNKVYPLNA